MATAVYVICALTSTACAALLLRAWLASRARLLLWSFLCFCFLAVNNVLLVVDLAIVPDTDLAAWRAGTALVGLMLLLYALIFDTREGRL